AREPVELPERIAAALVYVDDALLLGSDPQTAVAIAKHRPRTELPPDTLGGIRFGPVRVEAPDSPYRAAQHDPVAVFCEVHHGRHRRQAVEPRRTRLPAPEPGSRPRPQTASAVLVQSRHPEAKTAVLAVAPNAVPLDRAKLPSRSGRSRGPHDAV